MTDAAKAEPPWWVTGNTPPAVERPWFCANRACKSGPNPPHDPLAGKCHACSREEAEMREKVRARRELHERQEAQAKAERAAKRKPKLKVPQ